MQPARDAVSRANDLPPWWITVPDLGRYAREGQFPSHVGISPTDVHDGP
jgi:hypothetical protein